MKIFERCLVYFIQGDSTKLIKIGSTNGSIVGRLSNLQTGSPDLLRIIGVTFEPFFSEAVLHSMYKKYRQHGEWFTPDREILDFVETNCFHDTNVLYHAYYLILEGSLTYEQAITMSNDKLIRMSEKINMEKLNK